MQPHLAPLPEARLLDRARNGDEDAFQRLAEPHRRELQLHCYRMLGSLHDAEDLVQETLLRAWRRLDTFEGRASFRAWLYRIATNVSLNALAGRARRILPEAYGPPTDATPGGPPAADVSWLEPYPDALLEGIADPSPGPEAHYEARESVELAFVAAIQYLPPRQRAVLLLRDVLGWPAGDVADHLGAASVASVNSALQRARATLKGHFPAGRASTRPDSDPQERALIERYVRAWHDGDLDGFVALLKEDAILSMPPFPEWYRGRQAIRAFFMWAWGPQGPGPFRLLPTRANGQPAFGLYGRDGSGPGSRAQAIQVLALEGGSIGTLTGFVDPGLFPHFGLPASLPG